MVNVCSCQRCSDRQRILPLFDQRTMVGDGFVRLVDSMGNDMSVVKAARVSYGQESKGEVADQKLINYMMKHRHGTPFEHITFTFHIKCPIFVARQWFRHRIGSFNEISGRYVKLEADYWQPEQWRTNISHPKTSRNSMMPFSQSSREHPKCMICSWKKGWRGSKREPSCLWEPTQNSIGL